MKPLETVTVETGPSPKFAIIWMHGLGADGHDFEPIVPELDLPDTLAVRFLFPHAPMQPVTINGGAVMRAWYDVYGLEGARREDEAGVRASQARVEALIARETSRGVPAARIVLAGFSQGGAIALAAGLCHAQTLAGIVALSTYLPIAEVVARERSAANAATPIFQAHGSADPVVVMQRGIDSRDRLQALGYAVDWHSYPMAHAVCAEEIADLRRWLGARLAA